MLLQVCKASHAVSSQCQSPGSTFWETSSFFLWSAIPVENTWLKFYNELLFPAGIKDPLYSLLHAPLRQLLLYRWLRHMRGIGICWQHWGRVASQVWYTKPMISLSLMLQFAEGEKRYCHLCYRLNKYLDHNKGLADEPSSSLLTIRFPCCQEFPRLFWQQKLLGFRPSCLHLWLRSSILGWQMFSYFGLLFS